MAVATIPNTIDSTGTTDVTVALNHLFEITPDKTTITFATNGKYRLDGTLLLPNRAVTLAGDNSLLFGYGTGTRNRSQLRVTGGNSQIQGITIKGANPNAGLGDNAYVAALEAQHCLELVGVSSFTINGSVLSDPYGDLIYLASAPGINRCVRILNTTMARSGRIGVTINGASALLMEGCTISEIRRSMFDYEPTAKTTMTSGITIRGNHFGSHRLNFLSAAGGVLGVPANNWSIENNTSTSPFTTQFYGTSDIHRTNFRFVDNVTTGAGYGTPSGALISLRYVDRADISGNTCPLQKGRTPAMKIAAYSSCTGIVEQNNTT